MDSCLTFYLCPICFEAAEERKRCHDRLMVCYDGRCQTGEARKPLVDSKGDLRSQAPRWFLQAVASRHVASRHVASRYVGWRQASNEEANQRRVTA